MTHTRLLDPWARKGRCVTNQTNPRADHGSPCGNTASQALLQPHLQAGTPHCPDQDLRQQFQLPLAQPDPSLPPTHCLQQMAPGNAHPDAASTLDEFRRVVNMTSSELREWLHSPESYSVGMKHEGEEEAVGHQRWVRRSRAVLVRVHAAPISSSPPPQPPRPVTHCLHTGCAWLAVGGGIKLVQTTPETPAVAGSLRSWTPMAGPWTQWTPPRCPQTTSSTCARSSDTCTATWRSATGGRLGARAGHTGAARGGGGAGGCTVRAGPGRRVSGVQEHGPHGKLGHRALACAAGSSIKGQ